MNFHLKHLGCLVCWVVCKRLPGKEQLLLRSPPFASSSSDCKSRGRRSFAVRHSWQSSWHMGRLVRRPQHMANFKTLYRIGCAQKDVRRDMRQDIPGCAPGYAPLYVNEESLSLKRGPQPTNNLSLPGLQNVPYGGFQTPWSEKVAQTRCAPRYAPNVRQGGMRRYVLMGQLKAESAELYMWISHCYLISFSNRPYGSFSFVELNESGRVKVS